jgi:hypothetical protein
MANPSFEQLQSRFERLSSSAVTFEGIVYRSSTPKYATEADLLLRFKPVESGIHARHDGWITPNEDKTSSLFVWARGRGVRE